MPATPIKIAGRDLPDWVREEFPLLDAVYVGGCGCGATMFPTVAHARRFVDDGNASNGTICFRKFWPWDTEYPSGVFLHEYAHLVAGNRRKGRRRLIHDDVWKAALQTLLDEWGYDVKVKTAYCPPFPIGWENMS